MCSSYCIVLDYCTKPGKWSINVQEKKERKHTDYENDWYIGYRKFISCLNLSSDVVSMTFTGKLFHSLIDDGKKECR